MLLTLLALQACVYIDQSTLDARLDLDGDGVPYPTDCAPDDPAAFPGAPEICDGVDQDCDGEVDNDATDAPTWYSDADGDGHGDHGAPIVACDQPASSVTVGDDCNDADPAFYPGAPETDCTDSHDYNCDGSTGGADADGDGFTSCEDCDDSAPAVNPGASEVCDGADNNCDGTTDTDAVDVSTWFGDADNDGFGDSSVTIAACEAPVGYVAYDADCDDGASSIFPGADEVCNGLDDNCDELTDNDATDAALWYTDADSDGYGDGAGTASCAAPAGTSAYSGDCDDASARYHPGADESDCTDANDYNCDGATGAIDVDGDGYLACEECDDASASVHPEATELCNTIDDNCDGMVDEDSALDAAVWYSDADGDGYGDAANTTLACNRPSGHLADATDCDDANTSIHPGAVEACDALDTDEDCDDVADEAGASGESTWYQDVDDDGYGSTVSVSACDQPAAYVSAPADCDDSDPVYNPGALELDCSDPADYNCDGHTGYADLDGDGWAACEECDDGNAAVSPDGIEICNGIDDDCSGVIDDDASDATVWFEDLDGDGFGSEVSESACSASLGYVATTGDCDDTTGGVNPSATERCDEYDTDENCDGLADDVSATGQSAWYVDADADGFGAGASTLACDAPAGQVSDSTDCDDGAWATNPGAVEIVGDGVDENCDGLEDCYDDDDNDGFLDMTGDTIVSADTSCTDAYEGTNTDLSTDCDDADAGDFPGATETVGNQDDEDCNGGEICYDDDDNDGYLDTTGDSRASADTDCADASEGANTDLTTDCDDAVATVYPAATETCNGVDDDCDGTADDGLPTYTSYRDSDGDSYGDATVSTVRCTPPSGYVSDDSDCDDTEATVNPGAVEVCNNGADDDCDGSAGGCVPGDRSLADAEARYIGETAADAAGSALAAAGDVNGDGFGDILIGAQGNGDGGTQAGAAYLVLGAASPASESLSSASAQFTGSAAGDSAGGTVARVGDFNGDGYDDMLIGAAGNDDGGSATGAAYLLLGRATVSSLSLSSADAVYTGVATGAYADITVSGAGDVNADGYDDFVVGNGSHYVSPYYPGAVYLVLGGSMVGSESLSSASARYVGTGSEGAGRAVSGAGDFDGDGFDDLIIGAPAYRVSSYDDLGAAYLVLGGTSPVSGSLSTADAAYTGENEYCSAGRAVSGAGDVDADGYDDLLVGAPVQGGYGTLPGTAYLILGASTPSSFSLGGANAQYSGETVGDYAGSSVSAAGDVDADGYDDVLIGAMLYYDGTSAAGAGYLVRGSAVPASRSLSGADAKFPGTALDYAGQPVAGAGDVDSDGFADMLIGSYGDDGGGSNAGAAYLILGSGM